MYIRTYVRMCIWTCVYSTFVKKVNVVRAWYGQTNLRLLAYLFTDMGVAFWRYGCRLGWRSTGIGMATGMVQLRNMAAAVRTLVQLRKMWLPASLPPYAHLLTSHLVTFINNQWLIVSVERGGEVLRKKFKATYYDSVVCHTLGESLTWEIVL